MSPKFSAFICGASTIMVLVHWSDGNWPFMALDIITAIISGVTMFND